MKVKKLWKYRLKKKVFQVKFDILLTNNHAWKGYIE